MSSWKVVAIVAVGTLLGFLLNPQSPSGAAVWGAPPEGGAEPTGAQIGLLMTVGLVEAVAFGLGLAFLFYGRGPVARVLGRGGAATVAHLAIVWGLASWVPHTAMHVTNGDDLARLIVIEYTFHVSLVAAAAALAWAFVKAPRRRDAAQVAPTPA